MLRYTLTIFISAFLLFLIQPMAAKLLLPAMGGTATVWTACIMYFQVVLLLGYLYAHLLRSWFSPRAGCLIHAMLIIAAWFGLQLDALASDADSGRSLSAVISKNLTNSIGLPFLLLSATGPLIQAWHTVSHRISRPIDCTHCPTLDS